MTDPIADFLTRVRNAVKANHKVVEAPGGLPIAASCGRKAVSDIMRREVFLSKRKKNCMKTKPMQS